MAQDEHEDVKKCNEDIFNSIQVTIQMLCIFPSFLYFIYSFLGNRLNLNKHILLYFVYLWYFFIYKEKENDETKFGGCTPTQQNSRHLRNEEWIRLLFWHHWAGSNEFKSKIKRKHRWKTSFLGFVCFLCFIFLFILLFFSVCILLIEFRIQRIFFRGVLQCLFNAT